MVKNNNLWYIFGGAIIAVLITWLVIINVDEDIICNSPYILVGSSCCLDQNSNSICDGDESPPESTNSLQEGISQNETSIETKLVEMCRLANEALVLENKGYTCRSGNDLVDFQVSRGAQNIDLRGIRVLIDSSEEFPLDVTYFADLPDPNEEKVFKGELGILEANSISIAPIIGIGEMERECDMSIAVNLIDC